MEKTIFELLEITSNKFPEKIAFSDSKREICYRSFVEESKEIASEIIKYGWFNKPIAIFIDKNINCLTSMIATNYSGNFYTVIDTKMPEDRIKNIIKTLEPVCFLTDSKNYNRINPINEKATIINIDNIEKSINIELLKNVHEEIIDTNPMYVLFTSGSTGMPKGTVLTHKAVISYVTWYKNTFDINEKTIFGSQTPFYFSMSVSDVFSTMISGATLHIIPKMLFSFPVKLIEFLNEKEINTIYWVPSALCIIANFKALDFTIPKTLKNIFFAGEVMPTKQLNIWRRKLPSARFANLFGPTETTDICSYYIIDREFSDDENLPIGKHCNNCDLIILKSNNEIAQGEEEGELCARGSFLSVGYYKNPEKTSEVFIQNPLNNEYPEVIYRTGDLVKRNSLGELIYVSRKDFQIKHMGYRIELGEIENAANAINGLEIGVCIYDKTSSKIVLFYKSNDIENNTVIEGIKLKVPQYMWPNEIIKINRVPYNSNGKIDRKKLMSDYADGKYND